MSLFVQTKPLIAVIVKGDTWGLKRHNFTSNIITDLFLGANWFRVHIPYFLTMDVTIFTLMIFYSSRAKRDLLFRPATKRIEGDYTHYVL